MEASPTLHVPGSTDKRLSPTRWLIETFSGTVTFEGRARLPEGMDPPSDFPRWLEIEWTAFGDRLFRYRGSYRAGFGGGAGERGIEAVHARLGALGSDVHRCDRFTYVADETLESDEPLGLGCSVIEHEDGMPVAISYVGARDLEEEGLAERSLRETFGDALAIGAWEHDGKTGRAPVIRWNP